VTGDYVQYIKAKSQLNDMSGFDPTFIPDYLFDFQKAILDWSIRKGRSAIFADCGLGKSIMELVWAVNVHEKTKGRVLLLTPIAVGYQMLAEAEKFSIGSVSRSRGGNDLSTITISNYEQLHHFSPSDFAGVILDESSILKNFDGATRQRLNIFMRKIKYRLLATATAAPNDFIELGTSSEALGYLGHMDMLSRFFKNDQNTSQSVKRSRFGPATKWRLKGHAHDAFWRWVASWARAVRKPSDMGFVDNGFALPALVEREHELDISRLPGDGELFTFPAVGLQQVRDERRATIKERCEFVSELLDGFNDSAVVWCNLNDEGDCLEKIIPDSIQVSGKDNDTDKESKLVAFSQGEERVLVIKPKIGAWGLNWQHCNRITFFVAYSYEQYYQAVRRCWRFGQERDVRVDLIFTRGDRNSMKNLRRKSQQADEMFTRLIQEMNSAISISRDTAFPVTTEVPSWL
jgi:hypothetical protein